MQLVRRNAVSAPCWCRAGTPDTSSAQNAAAELEDVALRPVVDGEGIDFVTGHAAGSAAVYAALESGVDMIACQSTLRRRNIPEHAVLPGVRLLPAGLAEFVRLQHAGWAYAHP